MSDEAKDTGATIEDYLAEDRTFPPPGGFKADALVTDAEIYDEGEADFEGFWARQAADLLTWQRRLGHDPRVGPALRQVVRGRPAQRVRELPRPSRRRPGNGDRVAIHWEGEPGDTRTITYADLLAEVQRFANVLKGLGVTRATGSPSTCR